MKRVWPVYAASWATTGLTTSIGTLGATTTAGIAAGTVAAGAGIAAINRRKKAKTGTGLFGRSSGRSGGLLGSRSGGIGRSGGTGRLARMGRSMGLGRSGSKNPAGRSTGKAGGKSTGRPGSKPTGRSGRPTASTGRSTKPKKNNLFGRSARSGPGSKSGRSTKGRRPTSNTKKNKKKSWWGDDKSINALGGVSNTAPKNKTKKTKAPAKPGAGTKPNTEGDNTVANQPKITKNTDLGVPTQATYAIDASADMLAEQISQLPAVPKPEDQEAIYLAMGRMTAKFSTVLTEYGNKLDDPGIEDKAQSHDAVKSIANVLSQMSDSFADIAQKYHDANLDDFDRINSDKSNMAQWDVDYRGNNN